MVRSRSTGLARRRLIQVDALSDAAAVAQAVQNDAMQVNDAVVHRVLASLVLAETESIASQPVSTSEIKEHIGFASSRGKGSLINNSTIRRPTGAARCIRFFVGDKDGVARRQTADLPVRVGHAMDVDRSTS